MYLKNKAFALKRKVNALNYTIAYSITVGLIFWGHENFRLCARSDLNIRTHGKASKRRTFITKIRKSIANFCNNSRYIERTSKSRLLIWQVYLWNCSNVVMKKMSVQDHKTRHKITCMYRVMCRYLASSLNILQKVGIYNVEIWSHYSVLFALVKK